MTSKHYFDFDTFNGGWLDWDKVTFQAAKEIGEAFVGELLHRGSTRSVFRCQFSNDVVIKISHRSYRFQNQTEWEIWRHYSDYKPVAKWLAPCVSISSCGRVLVMRRTKPLTKLPKKMPSFLNDFKIQNFGLLDGRVVCHDYGLGLSVDRDKIHQTDVEWWNQHFQDTLK